MRRVIPSLLALCLVTAIEAPAQVTLGLKGGLNVSNISIDDPTDPDFDLDSRTGFTWGGWLQVGLGDVFAVQPEVMFSPKGGSRTIDDIKVSFDLSYIDVPLLLMARIPAGDSPILPVLYVGPVVSFETKCRVKGQGEGIDVSADCASIDDDPIETKSTDFGAAFGGGLEFYLGTLTMYLEARYNLGLVNIDDSGSPDEFSVKNRTWAFLFGLGYVLAP
jgi:hypothetical protein